MIRTTGGQNTRLDWSTAAKVGRSLSQADLDRYGSLFRAIDTDDKKQIDADVLELKLTKLGLTNTREEIGDLLHDIDVDGNGLIDFDEFVVLMQTLTSTVGDGEKVAARAEGPCLRGVVGRDMNWRELVWASLEDPGMSRCAQALGGVLTALIVVSVVALVIETMPELRPMAPVFEAVEVIATVVFTLEILARVLACPSAGAFCKFLNLVDVVAVMPLYLELLIGQTGGASAVGALRTFRVLRILKLSRYFGAVRLITGALRLSAAPLMMALFLTLLGCVLFASAMYYAERGQWDPGAFVYTTPLGRASEFQSIGDAMWWAVITVVTVGYGDVVPATGLGKFLGVLVALCGVVILAFPISIFAANFSDLYRLTRRRAALRSELKTDVVAGLTNQVKDPEESLHPSLARFPNPHLPPQTPSTSPVASGGLSPHRGPVATGSADPTGLGPPLTPQPGATVSVVPRTPMSAAMSSPAIGLGPPRPGPGPPGGQGHRRAEVQRADVEAASALLHTKESMRRTRSQTSSAMSPFGAARAYAARGASTPVESTPSHASQQSRAFAREARNLSEALAIARAARKSLTLERVADDSRILRASSFAATSLLSDEALQAACKALCRDARKRIWVKVRRREQKMKDAIAIELTRRWRSWFDMEASPAIKVSEDVVADKQWLQREASVLRLSELPPDQADGSIVFSPPCSPRAGASRAALRPPPTSPPAPQRLSSVVPGGDAAGELRLHLPAGLRDTAQSAAGDSSSRCSGSRVPSSPDGDPTAPDSDHHAAGPLSLDGEDSHGALPAVGLGVGAGSSFMQRLPPIPGRPVPRPDAGVYDAVRGQEGSGPLGASSEEGRWRQPDVMLPSLSARESKPEASAVAPRSSRAAGAKEDDSGDDGSVGMRSDDDGGDDNDIVYRKRTVTRLVRKGLDLEETTEVLEERRRPRRRRKRPG